MSEQGGQITLKEFFLQIKGLFAYLNSRRKTIILFALLGAVLAGVYAFISKPKYVAELNFVLSGGSSSNGLASLAGQFGIDLSNTSNEDAFQGDNIIELLKSQKIIKRVLFRYLPDSSELLVNVFAEEYGLVKSCKKDEHLKSALPFLLNQKLTPVQDSLIREVHGMIIDRSLQIDKVDKNLNFYSVSTKTSNEKLSVAFARNLVAEAIKFYVETKTKTAKDNLNMLQREADSLRLLLGDAVSSVAIVTDRTFNLNPALQVSRIGAQKSQFQAQVLGTAYGEVVKNLEIAKISLQKETPLVQIIDEPVLPLELLKKSFVLFAIIGFFFGAILSATFLVFKRLYMSIMTESSHN